MNDTTPGTAAATPCPRCGQEVRCAIAAGHSQCWCFALPPLAQPLGDGQSCLCPRCLAELQAHEKARGQQAPQL